MNCETRSPDAFIDPEDVERLMKIYLETYSHDMVGKIIGPNSFEEFLEEKYPGHPILDGYAEKMRKIFPAIKEINPRFTWGYWNNLPRANCQIGMIDEKKGTINQNMPNMFYFTI